MTPFKVQERRTAVEHEQTLFERAATPSIERIRKDRQRVSSRIEPLLGHIANHLFDPGLNVDSLKRACGVRDNSISIVFHSEVGDTPGSYITERRLETAARLLRDSELKVWQIATRVGYSGIAVFSRAFERWAGQRPRAFRRAARERPATAEVPEMPQELSEEVLLSKRFWERALAGELPPDQGRALLNRLERIYGPLLPSDTVVGETNGSVLTLEGGGDEESAAEILLSTLESLEPEQQTAYLRRNIRSMTPAIYHRLAARSERALSEGDWQQAAAAAALAAESLWGVEELAEQERAMLETEARLRLAESRRRAGDSAGAVAALGAAEESWQRLPAGMEANRLNDSLERLRSALNP